MSLHLSRLTLKRSPEIAPLIDIIQPAAAAASIEVDHRLIWTVMPAEFQASAAERRGTGGAGESPFLWRRDDRRGRYYVLGPKPVESSSLFDIESKPFEAALAAGDRLQFLLRLHATVDRRTAGRSSRMRSDIVVDLLHRLPPGQRAEQRLDLAKQAAEDWLARKGAADGFSLDALIVDGYRVAPLSRGRGEAPGEPRRRASAGGGRSPRDGIGILDLRGVLTVRQPEAFLRRVEGGFGRAKAFGCGLMLIRRA